MCLLDIKQFQGIYKQRAANSEYSIYDRNRQVNDIFLCDKYTITEG